MACSNPDTAFDNFGMPEWSNNVELAKVVKVTKFVKRKVSIFDKEEKYGHIQNLRCGRLDLIEITADEESSLREEVPWQ